MIFVKSNIFDNQLEKIKKKFPNVIKDFENFKNNFSLVSGKNLGKGIYKFRIGNSSISVGKRGGFRIILYVIVKKNKIIPTMIYSKTDKETASFDEILNILKEILKEL